MLSPKDPLYTYAEAARWLGMKQATLASWAKSGAKGSVLATPVDSGAAPKVSFYGLAEGYVVSAFRRAGVSMQHIKKALSHLSEELAVEDALVSQRLYTDGARVLFDYRDLGEISLVQVVGQQRVFAPVVLESLQRITYEAGYVQSLILGITERPILKVSLDRGFGQPMVVGSNSRAIDVLQRWQAGDSMEDVAVDFGVKVKDVEDLVRGYLSGNAA